MTNDLLVKFEMDTAQPNDELMDYAIQNINENPDTRLQTLAEFRDLLFERGECSPQRLDDEFLLRFLRARDFVVRHAHKLLMNYYEFREKHPEYFKSATFERLTAIGDAKLISTQPFFDKDGRRILFFRLGLWDPKTVTVVELFQATLLALELGALEPRSQILGGICIFDMEGISLTHLRHLTTKVASQIVNIIVSIYPLRTHGVHVVNQSPIFKTGYSMIKPFLNKEVKKRIFIHGSDKNALYQHILPKHLPKTLGGVHPDYGYREWVEHIKENKYVQNELNDVGYSLVEQVLGKK